MIPSDVFGDYIKVISEHIIVPNVCCDVSVDSHVIVGLSPIREGPVIVKVCYHGR